MAYLIDTEGEELTIKDYEGKKTWEVYVSPDLKMPLNDIFEYSGISLAVGVPEYLTDGENEYLSCGLLVTDLDQVFQEYLDDVDINDNGESLPKFIETLLNTVKKARAKRDELAAKYKISSNTVELKRLMRNLTMFESVCNGSTLNIEAETNNLSKTRIVEILRKVIRIVRWKNEDCPYLETFERIEKFLKNNADYFLPKIAAIREQKGIVPNAN